MQIVKHRERVTVVSYFHAFDYEGKINCGFSFDCNEKGVPSLKNAASKANYEACLTGMIDGKKVVDRGIGRREHTYFEPAVGLCVCGCKVELHSSWANDCDACGREYNGSGQLLADRSQWGEETGERF